MTTERSVEEIRKQLREEWYQWRTDTDSEGDITSWWLDKVTQTLQAERQKRREMVEAALYEVDVDKVPTIQDEAWANQFDSKAQAFWYGEAQAIKNIREALAPIYENRM